MALAGSASRPDPGGLNASPVGGLSLRVPIGEGEPVDEATNAFGVLRQRHLAFEVVHELLPIGCTAACVFVANIMETGPGKSSESGEREDGGA